LRHDSVEGGTQDQAAFEKVVSEDTVVLLHLHLQVEAHLRQSLENDEFQAVVLRVQTQLFLQLGEDCVIVEADVPIVIQTDRVEHKVRDAVPRERVLGDVAGLSLAKPCFAQVLPRHFVHERRLPLPALPHQYNDLFSSVVLHIFFN